MINVIGKGGFGKVMFGNQGIYPYRLGLGSAE